MKRHGPLFEPLPLVIYNASLIGSLNRDYGRKYCQEIVGENNLGQSIILQKKSQIKGKITFGFRANYV